MQLTKNVLKKYAAKVSVGMATLGTAVMAKAADGTLDITGVQAGIDAGKASGYSVGSLVLAAVAALAAIGLCISLVRKL